MNLTISDETLNKAIEEQAKPESISLCNCGNEATEPHPCPYASEMCKDNETLCNCCHTCAEHCFNDI